MIIRNHSGIVVTHFSHKGTKTVSFTKKYRVCLFRIAIEIGLKLQCLAPLTSTQEVRI